VNYGTQPAHRERLNRKGTLPLKMPKYIDSHPMGNLPPEVLRKLQGAPRDEFGVTHHDILFNQKENRVYCVLDAPSRDAVAKHHAHAGITCDFIHEVESTRE